MTKRLLLTAVAALTCFTIMPTYLSPAFAQVTELKVKKNKAYKHHHSKIKLAYNLTGYDREFGRSFFPNQLDVSVQYTSEDKKNYLSVYIYRNTNANSSIWFDRAKSQILKRDVYGTATASSQPVAFAPLEMKNPAALRVSYTTTGGQFSATGLMLIPVNGWYVKIRASSSTKTAEEVDQWMDQALMEIEWPKKVEDQPIATLIAACSDTLSFQGGAKAIAPSLENAMLAGILGAAASLPSDEIVEEDKVIWCRDEGQDLSPSAIYRANESHDSYLYALGDSGRAVGTAINGLGDLIKSELAEANDEKSSTQEYSISLNIPSQRLSFVERDRLPSPEELLKIIQSEGPTSATNIFGKEGDITIFNDDK